jgi:hypothetical protein
MNALDKAGIPGVLIASEEFRDAVASQSHGLGFPCPAVVYVPHPIQDRRDSEMQALATAHAEAIVHALVR